MATFGERLKLLRQDKKLTQKQISKLIDNTENGYQNYERNASTPHFNTLIWLADFFDVSLDYLVGRSNIKKIERNDIMQDYTIDNKRIFDDRRKEKIDGKIYLIASPAKEHREVQGNLVNIFNNYFKSNKKRCISIFDHDLKIDKNNILEPDLKVYCYGTSEEVPMIVVEVLSDSTRQNDLGIKMKKYAEFGVKEYWIITWELSLIDIYLLTEEKKYEYYASYSLSTEEDIFEDEPKEPVKEFTSISFPELKINLEDVFYFVK